MKPDEVRQRLRESYDAAVETRDGRSAPVWERAQRDAFLGLLQQEGCSTLLEVGAATGTDAEFFSSRGLAVVCIDLSAAMVERCRTRGLDAHVMDVADLRFPDASFDAAYANNCLVHVPEAEFAGALWGLRRILKPSGLLYLAVYGGRDFEGVWEGDSLTPKRFFSFHTDQALERLSAEAFDVESFECIPEGFGGLHYQVLILRKDPDHV